MTRSAPATKYEIAYRLRSLAEDMDAVAAAMTYYSDDPSFSGHAKEMTGAAQICREWSDEMLED